MPNYFRFLAILAFKIFAAEQVDVAIMEVGLGGKFCCKTMHAFTPSILGGVAGAMALVGIVIIHIWYCLYHKRSVSRTSETGSSDSSQVERRGVIELPIRDTRRFEMEELSLATQKFSDKNLIGEGKFGEVYQGLLQYEMLVAIKRHCEVASQELFDEVRYLLSIQHRNLVTLFGYCQENNLQFLIYEYVPNGSVSNHLYGAGQQPREKLEFKHRLAIAQGAAKGLEHSITAPIGAERNPLIDDHEIKVF